MQTTDMDDLERRLLAQEMVLPQLLAHQPNSADLLAHLEKMFTAKGDPHDTSDGRPDTTKIARGIIEAAKKVAQVHAAAG